MEKQSKKILIVDDQEHILDILTAILSANGYQVVSAASYDEALEKARESKPDIAILDYLLPEKNGGEILQALHSMPGLENLPIVFLTGIAVDQGDRPEQIKAYNRFYDALGKPINSRLLLDILHKKLSSSEETIKTEAA